MHYLKSKRVFITGACGTVGSALLREIAENPVYQPSEIVGMDNNESELFFADQMYLNDPRVTFYLGDIRDQSKIGRMMKGVDVVFHSAAFKHVVLCERSPFEAVQTNIHGVQNIIQSAIDNQVEKVIFTSSDKAVNPTNMMGASKLMGERLMTAASSNDAGKTIFVSTRFGNVLGSRGSVIPIFHKQIEKGGPVTLTESSMTRFVMTIKEAARLVIDTGSLAHGGEVFITKMPVVRIKDLAQVMIDEMAPAFGHDPASVEIQEIGAKPGEKLYEELMNHEETRRALELPLYFAILPAFREFYKNISYEYPDIVQTNISRPYVSSDEKTMEHDELRAYLKSNGLLAVAENIVGHPDQRYWPGDKEAQ